MSVLTIRNGAFVPGTTQNITTSGSAQSSSNVGVTTAIIRITCQQDTYVELGSSPNATANSMVILGGSTEILAVERHHCRKFIAGLIPRYCKHH